MIRHHGFLRPRITLSTDEAGKKKGFDVRLTWSAIRGVCFGIALLSASTSVANVCPVPSAPHPTIQTAVDDGACTEIVLAAQVFAESVAVSRSLLLRGESSATTLIEGQVTVTGNTTEVSLQDLQIDGAESTMGALEVAGGAQVMSQGDVVVVNGSNSVIFFDGFESGDTLAWSNTVP